MMGSPHRTPTSVVLVVTIVVPPVVIGNGGSRTRHGVHEVGPSGVLVLPTFPFSVLSPVLDPSFRTGTRRVSTGV